MTFMIKTIGTTALAALLSTAAFAADDTNLSAGGSDATAPDTENVTAAGDANNAGTDNVNEGRSEATTEFTYDGANMMGDEDVTKFLDQGRSGALTPMNDDMELQPGMSVGVVTMSDLEGMWDDTSMDTDPAAQQAYVEANPMMMGAVEEKGYVLTDVQTIYTDANGDVVIVVK
ncbi:hypothetical protein E0K89_017295 [Aquicoccus sp. SCR17]|nr:hypothetical protein [Carideicomes alvinocaridis]